VSDAGRGAEAESIMKEQIQECLAKAGFSSVFLIAMHGRFSNLVEVKHNATRGSSTHEREDMHKAAKALQNAGFDADIAGLTLLVRKAVKQPPRFTCDDYDDIEALYSSANDIEYGDMF
jgi:hypothetical protein